MKQTYELYLQGGPADSTFRPLTCMGPELVSAALAVLADTQAASCEIRQYGQPLFTLSAPANDDAKS